MILSSSRVIPTLQCFSTSSSLKYGPLSPRNPAIGAWLETERVFAAEDVRAFSALTGDNNPIHHDHRYAATTSFKSPIVHGILVASLFSFLMSFDGAIYFKQTLDFRAPVYVGAKVLARVEVTEVRQRSIGVFVTCSTSVTRDDGATAITGVATVIFPIVIGIH
jgi:enoyl-CoA hydratase